MSSSSSGGGSINSAASLAASAIASSYDFVGLPGSTNSGSTSSSSSSSNLNIATSSAAAATTTIVTQQNQGMAGLIIMLVVLCLIFAYCCWGAPFCRTFCRRYCCRCCYCCRVYDDSNTTTTESESGGFLSNTSRTTNAATNFNMTNNCRRNLNNDTTMMGTPTIILLPHGRMLVVDGTIFTQLQADSTGLDFVELGESVMRAQRNPGVNCRQLQTSQASIIEMDAETPSKDSMGSIGCFPPPTYESIYGKEDTGDMPPSYSDILLHRLANLPFEIEDYSRDSKDEVENRSQENNYPHIINNPFSTYNNHRRTLTNERNYSSLPRNPSLRSNPIDAYFVDNELAASRNQRRRRSATTLTTTTSTASNVVTRTRRTSCGGGGIDDNESPRNLRTNDTQLSRSENVIDDRFANNSWDGISRVPNDTGNNETEQQQQQSSRVNPIYTRSRRTTTDPENDTVQVHRYPEARYISDEEQSDPEDEANNFKVLADIRESRV